MHRIIHVAIYVNDLEMMKDFYTENFSAKAVSKYENESKKFSSYFLSFSSGPKLELMHNPDVKKDNSIYSGHFAISVGSKKKVDILSEKLKAKNVTVRSEPRITGDGCYESTILDPEFNIVEITV
ncbi:MAG: VOC family protein [Bacteroidales bacterium]|nr:VOC family protein [Bacteroidales bacterium]